MGMLENMIKARLEQEFEPEQLEIINESSRHAGHNGFSGEGETHFRVKIVARAFNGRTRVDQHKMIYEALADVMKDGIHALALESKAC